MGAIKEGKRNPSKLPTKVKFCHVAYVRIIEENKIGRERERERAVEKLPRDCKVFFLLFFFLLSPPKSDFSSGFQSRKK